MHQQVGGVGVGVEAIGLCAARTGHNQVGQAGLLGDDVARKVDGGAPLRVPFHRPGHLTEKGLGALQVVVDQLGLGDQRLPIDIAHCRGGGGRFE